MASFFERDGHKEARSGIQHESLDDVTRNALWNQLDITRERFHALALSPDAWSDETEDRALKKFWTEFLSKPRDEYKSRSAVWKTIKQMVLKGDWSDVLDTLETIVNLFRNESEHTSKGIWESTAEGLNDVLIENLTAYRFRGSNIEPIDSKISTEAITAALDDTTSMPSTHRHLEQAMQLLKSHNSPDYPNSVKESISAVEAAVLHYTGKDTLGNGLKALRSSGLDIHPALQVAWLKMYGWASAEDGVRHGGAKPANVDLHLAKYTLITCSAFISYLADKE